MLELLAPAGSMEALRAAVQNGADAVYLGGDAFNARMSARNFSPDDLRDAAAYCRVRGVKVHLTLNTLVSDRELPGAAAFVEKAARYGVNAFIVQDLGMLRLCRRIAPEVAVHASTQMSIHSLSGVRAAAELGCSRVVLARELPAAELRTICGGSPVEIEVFGHGALCVCYSGQCYFSAVVGRRSGNRGQCAQPCRVPYGYGRFERRHPLSLKDNRLIEHLRTLEELGVTSLKLEGRMKRPEYVAVTTRIYRAALDGQAVRDDDLRQLELAFSRQGFTDGYFQGRVGREMLGVRDGEREDAALFSAARASYENRESPRVPVRFQISLRPDFPARLRAEDPEGRASVCTGEVPKAAVSRPLTPELLEERLRRTGGTPYRCASVEADVAPGLTLSVAAVNGLRRDALARLTELRSRPPGISVHTFDCAPHIRGNAGKPALTVQVRTWEQVTDRLLQARPAVLYVPLSRIAERPERVAALPEGVSCAAALPRVVWDRETEGLLARLDAAGAAGVREVLAGNLGQLALAGSRGLLVRGDFGLNLFNSETAAALQRLGLISLTASFELRLSQIRDLSKPVPTELIAYGRLPLMLTENCLIKNRTGACACRKGVTELADRTGEIFPVLPDPGTCRSVVYNGKILSLLDKRSDLRDLGLWALRLSFTTESPAQVDRVVQAWEQGGALETGQYTRGLYYRGVE